MAGFVLKIILLVLMCIDFLAILFVPLFIKKEKDENKVDREYKIRRVRNYMYIAFGAILILFLFVAAFIK